MKKVLGFFLSIAMASGFSLTGCKQEGNGTSMLYALLALAGPGSTTYRGVTPEGDFVEMIINRAGKTVTLSNYTTGETGLGPYAYAGLDPSTEGGGFTIINRAAIGTGDALPDNGYILFTEAPGEIAVTGVFYEDGSPYLGPVFGMAVDNGPKSQYYSETYNLLHIIEDDDGMGHPDGIFGFAAFDRAGSTPLDGQLWGVAYSLRHDDGYPLGDGNFGVSSLEKDAVTGAWVDWDAPPADPPSNADWDDAVALLGNHDKIVEFLFGANTGLGGGGIAIPQTESGAFNASKYPGTYATITYTYDCSTETMDVPEPYRAEIAADAQIQIFDFNGNPLFSATLEPWDEDSINYFYTTSGISASSDPGIRPASECRGMFLASESGVTLIVILDPDGRYAGFYLVNYNSSETIPGDDFIAFGLAIKDGGYVNP